MSWPPRPSPSCYEHHGCGCGKLRLSCGSTFKNLKQHWFLCVCSVCGGEHLEKTFVFYFMFTFVEPNKLKKQLFLLVVSVCGSDNLEKALVFIASAEPTN